MSNATHLPTGERIWSADEWRTECAYLSAEMGKPASQRPGHFASYCTMQRNTATRHGQHDAAEYIQHILDDLEGAQS